MRYFYVAPVLSQALFGDWFINRRYQPLSGLEYRDFRDLHSNTINRLMHGLRSTLTTALGAGDYWQHGGLERMADHLESAAGDVHRQVRVDANKYEIVHSLSSGLKHLIKDTVDHLYGMDQETFDALYVHINQKRNYNILDCLSDFIVTVLCSFANDFDGHEDVYWTTALGIVNTVFPQFQEQPDGMSSLQQRVAIKMIKNVKVNMKGYYPALTRILLPVMGPYDETGSNNPNSAFGILRKAFYAELRHFPDLYEKDPGKSSHYLPKNVEMMQIKMKRSCRSIEGERKYRRSC